MTRHINLARVFIPSPEYDALAGGVYGVSAKALDGVLCELVDAMPNRDDLPMYREFYEILDGVYNMACVSGLMPVTKPFVRWYQANKVSVGQADDRLGQQKHRYSHDANVLNCGTIEEYHLLEHIHSNFVNKLNNRPVTNYTKKLPACFDTDLKNERVRALVQKWAFPQRYK